MTKTAAYQITLVVSSTLALGGCGTNPYAGESTPIGTGGATAGSGGAVITSTGGTSLTGTSTAGPDAGAPDTPGAENAIGQPCNLTVTAGASQAVYNASASECPSNICLKPGVFPGAPMPNPPTTAFCSASCSQDSDCAGELRDLTNPLDTGCARGFACGIPFDVGPLCCEKLCMCKDFLGPAGAVTPIACQGNSATKCTGTTSTVPVGQQTDIYIAVAPRRLLDLVFMIDNSPSMAPKQDKLKAQFPKLIAALKDPNDGTLPDLRVAIIDSDLGTGGAYQSGSCGPKTLPDGTNSNYGDMGQFQMIGATACGVTKPDATYLETQGNTGINFNGDINSVFTCLAGNLGTVGCGEEHQLQAFEFAFLVSNIPSSVAQRTNFLRDNAYLGLVFLSDEDDCSAVGNDEMFGNTSSDLSHESASIRCYTRSYTCNGNYTANPPPGYPTSAAFSTAMSNCSARVGDTCSGVDVSQPTPKCNPLTDYKGMADQIKSLKSDPDNQLLVAGIFGWPLDGDTSKATYKVDLTPNPNSADTAHPTIWDTWPVCYDPNHQPGAATTDKTTGFDPLAAGWGATPGLRMSAFIDEFGANGLKYSICQPDFTAAMNGIGNAIANKLQNLCVNYKLWTDPTTGQADCRVAYSRPQPDGTFVEDPVGMPECAAGQTINVSTNCWYLVNDTTKCPVNGQIIEIARSAADITQYGQQLPAGTKVHIQCTTCPDFTNQNGKPLTGC